MTRSQIKSNQIGSRCAPEYYPLTPATIYGYYNYELQNGLSDLYLQVQVGI
jgi:hypothetical protein